MDRLDNERRTADDLALYGREQGVDLAPFSKEGLFTKDRRWIFLWRADGKIHYHLQGNVMTLPSCMSDDSIVAFRGVWGEEGSVEDLSEALQLVKMWLLDQTEIDDLPKRAVRRAGI